LTPTGSKAIAVDEGSQDTIEPSDAPKPQAKNVPSPDEDGRPAGVATPRDGSKLALVIEHLQRADGATMVDLTYATGWLPHTTRAALTGLRKRGYAVIRERIGAGDSVYRISDASIHREDRTLPQRDAVDGREPKQKATQAGEPTPPACLLTTDVKSGRCLRSSRSDLPQLCQLAGYYHAG
jgi:hypothetical protein